MIHDRLDGFQLSESEGIQCGFNQPLQLIVKSKKDMQSYLYFANSSFEQLIKYSVVGLLNTAVHGAVFAILAKRLRVSYSLSNLLAFSVAVTVSFVANSLWTFAVVPSTYRYMLFVSFMGAIAFATGYVGDQLKARAFIVFVCFSSLSFLLGFIYSKLFVF